MSPATSIRSLIVGPLAVNCYILYEETRREAAVIDPGGDGPSILRLTDKLGLSIKYVLNTHGHCDHTGANVFLRKKTGCRIAVHDLGARLLCSAELDGARVMSMHHEDHKPDFTFSDSEFIDMAGVRIWILHTPGHSRGSSCFFIKDGPQNRPALFSGDTLFAGGIGRTDLFGGDPDAMMNTLKRLVLQIDPSTRIYPGHGPATVMEDELKLNPYLQDIL